MKVRRSARRLAVDVLYEAEIRDMLPEEAFAARQREGWVVPAGIEEGAEDESSDAPVPEVLDYALALVKGVQAHHADLDELIVRYADRWAIERMPVIDRTLLRIALFELLWGDDIPVAVAINEAVELAKSLSTEDSGRFINGVLGRVVEERAEN
ncbi:MAG: transcription antitermination factor NusB [Actinomycetota bacterium]